MEVEGTVTGFVLKGILLRSCRMVVTVNPKTLIVCL
jgi:hypothetical protein